MAELYLLRHYPTDWNTAKRIQGHTDVPLSDSSYQSLHQINPACRWFGFSWVSSPMLRARQTCEALGIKEIELVDALEEMNWGEFEGVTLEEIEKEIVVRQIQPDIGLHFRPPGGESPAEVCTRLKEWLSEPKPQTTVAVTHKGVIRAAISMATGWDMETPYGQNDHPAFAEKMNWLLPLKFNIEENGGLALQKINVALE